MLSTIMFLLKFYFYRHIIKSSDLLDCKCKTVIAAKSHFLYTFPLQCHNLLWLCSICSDAFHLAASAQLAVSPTTKQVELPFCDDTCVTSTTGHFWDLMVKIKFPGLVQILAILVAELAVVAIAPGVDLALVSEQCWVLLATGEIWDMAVRQVELSWFVLFVCSLYSKLTVPVWTPWVKLAVLINANSEIDSTFNLHYVWQFFHLLREIDLIPVTMP